SIPAIQSQQFNPSNSIPAIQSQQFNPSNSIPAIQSSNSIQQFNSAIQFNPAIQLPDYPITQLLDSSPAYPPLILLLKHVRGVQIEGGGGAFVCAAKLRVAAITDRAVLQPSVDDEIDEDGGGENAVRDQVAAEVIKAGADRPADDHDGQAHLRVEVLARVEVGAAAHRAAVDGGIAALGLGDAQRNPGPAAAAANLTRCVRGGNRQAGVALRAPRQNLHDADYRSDRSAKLAASAMAITTIGLPSVASGSCRPTPLHGDVRGEQDVFREDFAD